MTEVSSRRVCVVYGSQTGTAADAAAWISDKLRGSKIFSEHIDGNSFVDQRGFDRDEAYIFIVSTAGNGDFPSNFKKFWNHLKRSNVTLEGNAFAVFGLGDSKYPQFNYAARKVFGRMLALAATPICLLGCGDEKNRLGYSQEFIPWVKLLWKSLLGTEFRESKPIIKRTSLQVSGDARTCNICVATGVTAQVFSNARLTSDSHFQDVRHLKLRLLKKWYFQPGDVLVVQPRVDPLIATDFLTDVLKLNPDFVIVLRVGNDSHVPAGIYNLLELFTNVLDVTASPSHVFYERLYAICSDRLESLQRAPTDEETLVLEKLETLAAFSAEGVEERLRYSARERLGIHEVLKDFSQFFLVTLEEIFDVIPRIQPRYYSVCGACHSDFVNIVGSSARVPVCDVEICVGIVDYRTTLGRQRTGLASRYLKTLKPGDLIFNVDLERGFSPDLTEGLGACSAALLVGPGTGIAPLRAIIQDNASRKELLLITGFRHVDSDFLFRNDIENGFSQNVQSVVAWSRPGQMDRSFGFAWSRFPDGQGPGCSIGRKTWVQDLTECERDLIHALFKKHKNVLVVISGRSHPMPYQVVEGLRNILGSEIMRDLETDGHVVYDTWG
jgi:sulfite reductase alpha subunit-like flavoprotein